MEKTLSQPSLDKDESSDSFSFPSTPNQYSEFEFRFLTPDSPSTDTCKASPADKLFFNGRLQPHSFPVIFHHPIATATPTSKTSSISSKDSLVSSRSNSTNSSKSARTSSSDNSERTLFHNKTSSYSKGSNGVNRSMGLGHNKAYGCSRRWQYITAVPALNRDASKRRNGDMKQRRKKEEGKKRRKKKKNNNKKKVSGVGLRFVWRILRWFVMTCRECHAMEPSRVKNQKIKLQKNVNIV